MPSALLGLGLFAALVPSRTASVPFIDRAPVLDGRLDEEVWARAALLSDFVVMKPNEGTAPSQETRAYVYRDARNLYVAFDAVDREPSRVRATFSDRDKLDNDDVVGVVLDPFEDH